MNSRDVRRTFTRFFEERGHRHIPSSSLIPPPEERTMLFTTAGMVQMKPYFMGLAEPVARRLITVQKCFRTNDIEEVGDVRHCTFFEMLGNFSVGDYFKAEVIPWAYQLLTSPQPEGMALDASRIWVTIFQDDEEAHDLWSLAGIPEDRIIRFGEKDNYWFMGPVGPCGPNTEINYDFGADQGCLDPDCGPNCDRIMAGGGPCDRFIELWNLVFMTLFQSEDGTRRPLPQRNVDTGAGFERWMMPVLWQDKADWQGNPKQWTRPPTIYDTDSFRQILAKVSELVGIDYDAADDAQRRAMRIVAEHARGATFLIADGVTPANDGRGYVLRRLIRRGTSFGQRLASGRQYLAATAEAVIDHLAEEHPHLVEQRDFVLRTLRSEEARFQETLIVGRSQLEEFKRAHADKQIAGSEVFQLWDTHGFPPELTLELLAEDGFAVADPDSFEALMSEQRERSRAGGHFVADAERIQTYVELGLPRSEFVGYDDTRSSAQVSAIVIGGDNVVRSVSAQDAPAEPPSEGSHPPQANPERLQTIEIVLTQTPFYAEGGGQLGDRGELVWEGGRFVVEDTQAVGEGGVVAHLGHLESGTLTTGATIEARVDEDRRGDTMRNHTATHILHAALRQVLGTHVRQAGSLVTPDRLRFDFTHLEALTPEQLRTVEALSNKVVRENLHVHVDFKSYEDALAGGALAFFGDKYAATVRVVGVCDIDGHNCFSHELCGGTHAHASGDIGSIVITAETSIGAGLRRLEAVTGRAAADRQRQQEDAIARLSAVLATPPTELESRLTGLREENDRLRRQLQTAERRLARSEIEAAMSGGAASGAAPVAALTVGDTSVVVQRLDVSNADSLRAAGDAIKDRYQSAVILLAAVIDGKPSFLAMATPDVARRASAGDIVRVASKEAGGGGGGRPELAQGGGTDPAKIDAALAAGRKLIEERLKATQ